MSLLPLVFMMVSMSNEAANSDRTSERPEGNGLIGRESEVIPGRFGEPQEIARAMYSQGGGKARPTRPMFLCLHGWGSNERDLAQMMSYVAPGNDYVSLRAPLVLQAEGTGEFGSGSGAFSWYHDSLPTGEDLDRDIFAAATAVDNWVARHIETGRELVPIGFSQGAALAIHLLRVDPERYRAAVALSGFVAPGQVPGTAPADERLSSMERPVFYGYGDMDSMIPKYEIHAATAWLEEHTWLTMKHYRQLDHAVSLPEFSDLRQWLLLNNISSGVM
jgi:phospholipase/carboxylesterase